MVTKLVANIKHWPYSDRLQRSNMYTLGKRRVQDLTETYKIVHGVGKVNCSKFFTPALSAITGEIVLN